MQLPLGAQPAPAAKSNANVAKPIVCTYMARSVGHEKVRSSKFAQLVDLDDFFLCDAHLRKGIQDVDLLEPVDIRRDKVGNSNTSHVTVPGHTPSGTTQVQIVYTVPV